MLGQKNLSKTLIALVIVASLMIGWGTLQRVEGAGLELPTGHTPFQEEEPTPEEPAPTEPPAEEPSPTEPAPEEPPPAEPEAPEPEPGEGGLGRWGTLMAWAIVGVAGVTVIAIVVVLLTRPGKGEEAPPEVPSVPITTVAEDIKEGRVSKVVVRGEVVTITRTDGLMMVSHKEPTADLVQLLTNLGVTPEQMSKVVIEVE
jgi:hypothetical protein